MLTEAYIDALLVDEELADLVWMLWDRGDIDAAARVLGRRSCSTCSHVGLWRIQSWPRRTPISIRAACRMCSSREQRSLVPESQQEVVALYWGLGFMAILAIHGRSYWRGCRIVYVRCPHSCRNYRWRTNHRGSN